MKAVVAIAVLGSMLCCAPAGAQGLLQGLKDAVVGPPTQADIAAARSAATAWSNCVTP